MMPTLPSLRALLLVVGAATLAGCYSYRPSQNPMPGSTVRVHIPVRTAIDDPNAPPQTATVEGELLAAPADTIVLAMVSRQQLGAFREFVQFDTVRLSLNQLSGVEEREFSRGKSIGLGVGIAGLAAVGAVAALGLGGSDTGPGFGEGGSGVIPAIVAFVGTLIN